MMADFSLFSEVFGPIWTKLGLRDENIGRDLHFAPVDGPRTFLKNYVWSRYYCNFGFWILDWCFELFMASPAKTTILTRFGPIWSLYFRSRYISLSRVCQFYAIFSAAVLKKNLSERRLDKTSHKIQDITQNKRLSPKNTRLAPKIQDFHPKYETSTRNIRLFPICPYTCSLR